MWGGIGYKLNNPMTSFISFRAQQIGGEMFFLGGKLKHMLVNYGYIKRTILYRSNRSTMANNESQLMRVMTYLR